MNLRCGIGVIALGLLALVGRTARAEVIIDDSLTDATPDEARAVLGGCASIPGCTAIWHEGSPAVVILEYTPPEGGGVDAFAPPSNFDQRPSEPNPPSTDVDDSVADPGAP